MKIHFLFIKFFTTLVLLLVFQQIFGQTTLLSDAGTTHANTDAVVTDTYGSVDVSNCSSVVFSFDYEFSEDWEGSGNMEMAGDCGSFGDCPGDINMPDEAGCDSCWDFLLVDFLIDGAVVGGDFIGDNGTTDAEQFGTITTTFCTSGNNSTAQIEAATQNWGSTESVTYSNITIVCYEGLPEAQAFPDPICESETLNLNGSVDDPGVVVSTDWSGPGTIDDPFSLNTTVDDIPSGNQTFTLSSTDDNNCVSTDDIDITVDPGPTPGIPDDLQVCYSLVPAAGEILNLDDVIDQISNFDPSLTVEWWFDMDATISLDFTDPSDIQTLVLTQPSTIYATVSDGNCQSATQAVNLSADEYPDLVSDNGSLTECSNNGNAVFNPSDAEDQFTGGDGSLIVSYHNNQTDAEDGENEILGTVSTGSDLTIFVRVENAAGCSTIAELDLIIGNAATAFDSFLEACDDGTGSASFDLTSIEGDVLNGDPGNVTFYEDPGAIQEIFITDSYISGDGFVYAVIDDGGNCFSNTAEIELSLITFNLAEAFLTFDPDTGCGPTDVGPTLHVPATPTGDYTFNINYGPVSTGATNNVDVTGTEGETPFIITAEEDYLFILNSVTSPAPNSCEQVLNTPIEYNILIISSAEAFPASLSACADINGEGLFDLTSVNNTVNDNSGNPVDYFEDMALLIPIGNPTNFMSVSTTVFAVVDAGDGCVSSPVDITLTVNDLPQPTIVIQEPITCNGDADAVLNVDVIGNDPYTYDWSIDSWDGLSNVTDVDAGEYFLTVTDANTCSATTSIIVDNPTVISLDCHENSALEGSGLGSYAFTYSGGMAPYNLDLDGPIMLNFIANAPDTWQSAILPEGDYTFTLTDANGCMTNCTFTIPPPCNLVIDCSQLIVPSTAVSLDGGLNLSISGGIAPYSVSWDGPVMGNAVSNTAGIFQITGLSEGPYTVTVQDANAVVCSQFCGFILTSDFTCNFTADINGTDLSCNNAADGSITFTLNNGVADYDFVWSDPNLNSTGATGDQAGLAAGVYAVTITDMNDCVAMASTTLSEPPAISLSCTVTDHPSMMGSSDGQINVVINDGPAGAFTINYDNGAGSTGSIPGVIGDNIIPNLPEGTFNIQVINGACEQICQLTLSSSNCTFELTPLGTNETCMGENDGMATVIASGGNIPYTFNWSNMEMTPTITNLAPGEYYVTVTDGSSCIALDTVVILNGTELPTLTYGVPSNSICSDSCLTLPLELTGQGPYELDYEILITGIPQNFQLSINNDISSLDICPAMLGIPPGNFRLTLISISDINCSRTLNEVIQLIYLPQATGEYSKVLCPGDSLIYDGIVFNEDHLNDQVILEGQAIHACDSLVNVSITYFIPIVGSFDSTLCLGGSMMYGGVLFDENNLSQQITLTDAASTGCDSLVDVTIDFHIPIVGTFDSTLCLGGSMMYGGILFDEGNLNQQITLTDAASTGCDSLVDVTIDFHIPIVGTFDSTLCLGGSMMYGGVLFDENNLSQQITLTDAASTGCDSLVDVTIDFHIPIVGTFDSTLCLGGSMMYGGVLFDESNLNQQITLTDAASTGCDSLVDVTIDFFELADSTINQSICQGDTIFFGGQAFHADHLSEIIILNNASINGCDSTIIVDLTLTSEVYGLMETTLCAGDSITIEGQLFHQGLLHDTIPLGILSASGCDTLLIVDIELLQPSIEVFNTPICPGDSLFIGGQFFHSGLLNDTITLDNASVNGCDSILEVNLQLLTNPVFDFVVQLCEGDTLFVGDEIQTIAGMMTYTLENQASNGCDSIVNVDLSFYEPATSMITPTTCSGDTILVGDQIFDVVNPDGLVTLEGASANGCDSLITVNAIFLPNTVGDLDSLLCFGESLQVGDQVFNAANPSGLVLLENMAVNGCDSTVFVTTTYHEQLTATLTGGTLICPNESATIGIETSGDFIYNYTLDVSTGAPLTDNNQTGNQMIPVMPNTSTIYTLTDITSTSATCPISILTPTAAVLVSELNINASVSSNYNGFDVSCPEATDGSALVEVVDGIGPFTYTWSNNAITPAINNLATGTYSVMVTDGADCSQEATISLGSSIPMSLNAEGIGNGCFGDSGGQINIESLENGLAPYEYSLDGEFFSTLGVLPTTLNQLPSANYTLYVQDANDCIISENILVPEAEQLIMELGDDEEIVLGDSVLLNPLTNFTPVSWTWNSTSFLSQPDTFITYASPPETVVYQLELVNENGCSITDQIRIYVSKNIDVYIPSAFSPNGDGTNDKLTIFTGEGVDHIKSFQIFDRWGEQVFFAEPFIANDPFFGWDGELDGQPLNSAVFVYYAEVVLIDGQEVLVKGDVVLLR